MKRHNILICMISMHIGAMENTPSQSSSDENSKKKKNYCEYKFELQLPDSAKGHLFEFLPGLKNQNGKAEFTVISSKDLPEDDAVFYTQAFLLIKYNEKKKELYLSGFELALNELSQPNRSPQKKAHTKLPFVITPKIGHANRFINKETQTERFSPQFQRQKINNRQNSDAVNQPSLSWSQRNMKTIIGIAALSGCLFALAVQWGIKKLPNWQAVSFTK